MEPHDLTAITMKLTGKEVERLLEYQDGHVYSGAEFTGDRALIRKGLLDSKPLIVSGRIMKKAGHRSLTPLGMAVLAEVLTKRNCNHA